MIVGSTFSAKLNSMSRYFPKMNREPSLVKSSRRETTSLREAKIDLPTSVFRMKSPKRICSPTPQPITRKGICLRFTPSTQASTIITRRPTKERSRCHQVLASTPSFRLLRRMAPSLSVSTVACGAPPPSSTGGKTSVSASPAGASASRAAPDASVSGPAPADASAGVAAGGGALAGAGASAAAPGVAGSADAGAHAPTIIRHSQTATTPVPQADTALRITNSPSRPLEPVRG